MTSLPKFLLVLGILMTAGGVAGTGYFYRDMKIENLMHARTGDVPLSLANAGDWSHAAFNVFRSGSHELVLFLKAAPGGPPGAQLRAELEIEVFSPDGATILRKSVTPDAAVIPRPDSVATVSLGSFDVGQPSEEPWRIRARVVTADAAFAGVSAELSVLPPQMHEIGSYLSAKLYTLVGMGILAVAGFVVIVFSAYLQQRADAPRKPAA